MKLDNWFKKPGLSFNLERSSSPEKVMINLQTYLGNNIKSRVAKTWPPMLAIFLLVCLFLYCVYRFAIYKGISPESLTLDPNAISGMSFYIGGVTFLCVILWTVASSFSFMGAFLVNKSSRKFWFLLSAGSITTLLVLDEAYQLHQNLIPGRSQTSENIFYIVYLLFVLAFLLYFLQEVFNDTDFPILGVSLLCMGVAMISDVFIGITFIEDCLKLFGLALWVTYFSGTAINWVHQHMRSGGSM